MQVVISQDKKKHQNCEVIITSAYCKASTRGKSSLDIEHWPKSYADAFNKIQASKQYKGGPKELFSFTLANGSLVLVLGLGEKEKITPEILRKEIARFFKSIQKGHKEISIGVGDFKVNESMADLTYIIKEALILANYQFDKHKTSKTNSTLAKINLFIEKSKFNSASIQKAASNAQISGNAINFARDLVNEAPNFLTSERFSKIVEKDARALKGVRVKILNKQKIKQEKMGLFLSVNAGSNYDPRLVHLSYTPTGANSKTKHIALVGKGITFDSGGYSLKPPASMVTMKIDMAGAATVYAAFKAAVQLKAKVKISCYLGLTDNVVSEKATLPGSIVKGRNGKTVEIQNTDAEGRLLLADILSYASDSKPKPDAIIDVATLTGAILTALGSEVCGIMSNHTDLTQSILSSAKQTSEYLWELPIIDEFRNDLKSLVADLSNMGGSRLGGASKAAAFLENFVAKDIPWAHIDIAGVCDNQSHLPYCPPKGASGLMVRTLTNYLTNI